MAKTESLLGYGQLLPLPKQNDSLEVKYQFQFNSFEPGEDGQSNWQGYIFVPHGTKLPGKVGPGAEFLLKLEQDDGRSFTVLIEKLLATAAGMDSYPISGQAN